MNSHRPIGLLAFLVALLLGVWLCNENLGGGSLALNASDGTSEVLAANGALSPIGLEPDQLGTQSTSESQRQAIDVPVAAALEESANDEPEIEFDTRLTGTVVRGDAPVVGAKVVVRRTQPWFSAPADMEDMQAMAPPGPRHETTTDSEGKFMLLDIPPGKLALSIRARGMAPLVRGSLDIPEHEDYDLGRFQMTLGIQLEGKVFGAGGKGLAGVQILSAVSKAAGSARLELPGMGIPLTVTDEEGVFEVEGLAPGGWHLIFDAPTYRVFELQGKTEPEGQRERGLVIRMEEGLAIGGKVLGMESLGDDPLRVTARRAQEQPSGAADEVKGAELFRPRHAMVESDGTFSVTGLAPGVQYKLRLYRKPVIKLDAEDKDKDKQSRWSVIRGVEDVDEMAGAQQVEFKYREEAVLVLNVKNAEGGAPLSKFQVFLMGDQLGGAGMLKDDADETREEFPAGAVRFEGLTPGEGGSSLTLRIRAVGFADHEQKGMMLRPGQELVLDDVKLEPAPMGKVEVLDKDSGKAVEGARVLYSKSVDSKELARYLRAGALPPTPAAKVREAVTNAKGIARLTLWEDAVCVLQGVAEGYQAADQKRHVPPFDETVKLELTRGGQITVHVRDGRGKPVVGMFVEHAIDGAAQGKNRYWDPNSALENKTGESGDVTFTNLPKGKHGFTVLEKRNMWGGGGEDAGFEAKGDVFLSEGETKELDLRVESRGGLNVVLLEVGEPLAGALVKIKPVDAKAANNSWWFGPGQQDPRTQISDHAGSVKFKGIKVGRYLLRVSHADRRMVISREVYLTVDPDELRMELGLATVDGRVVDPAGEPIAGMPVTVYSAENRGRDNDMNDYSVRITEDEDGDADWNMDSVKQWSIRTDEEGRFVLRGVAPGERLTVSVRNSYVIGKSKELGPLGDQEYVSPFEFVLERAGALRLEVPGIDRRERSKYRLVLTRMEGEEEKETREERMRSWRSNLSVQSMRPGRWRIRLFHKDLEAALVERFVDVRIQETERITLRL